MAKQNVTKPQIFVTFFWCVMGSVPQLPACSSKGTERSCFQNFHRTWFVSDKVISLLWHLPKKSKIANFDELKFIQKINLTIRARISSVLQYLLVRSFFSESRSDASFWWQTVFRVVTFQSDRLMLLLEPNWLSQKFVKRLRRDHSTVVFFRGNNQY